MPEQSAYIIFLNENEKEIGRVEFDFKESIAGEKIKIDVEVPNYPDGVNNYKLELK